MFSQTGEGSARYLNQGVEPSSTPEDQGERGGRLFPHRVRNRDDEVQQLSPQPVDLPRSHKIAPQLVVLLALSRQRSLSRSETPRLAGGVEAASSLPADSLSNKSSGWACTASSLRASPHAAQTTQMLMFRLVF
ncbi:hypothetical protein GN956_G11178 [Arapaima gigas]